MNEMLPLKNYSFSSLECAISTIVLMNEFDNFQLIKRCCGVFKLQVIHENIEFNFTDAGLLLKC